MTLIFAPRLIERLVAAYIFAYVVLALVFARHFAGIRLFAAILGFVSLSVASCFRRNAPARAY